MSGTLLPIVDLSAAIVGTVGSLSLTDMHVPPTEGARAHAQFYNESGCALAVWFGLQPARQFLAAGAWRTLEVPPGESVVWYQVLSTLPGAPISLLSVIYYNAGERVEDIGALGNSPIGGGVDVNNPSMVESLAKAYGTYVVVAVPTGTAQDYVRLTNDGSFRLLSRAPGATWIRLDMRAGDGLTNPSGDVGTVGHPEWLDVHANLHGTADDATHATAADSATDSAKLGGELPAAFAHKAKAWDVEGTAAGACGPAAAGGQVYDICTQAVSLSEPCVVTVAGAFAIASGAVKTGRLLIVQDATRIAQCNVVTSTTYTTAVTAARTRKLAAGNYTFKLQLWVDAGDTLTLNKTIGYPESTFLSIAAVPYT